MNAQTYHSMGKWQHWHCGHSLPGNSLHPLWCFPSPDTGHSISHIRDLSDLKTKWRKIKREKTQTQQQKHKIHSLTQFLVSAWSCHVGRAVQCRDEHYGMGRHQKLAAPPSTLYHETTDETLLENSNLYKQNNKHGISNGTLMMTPSMVESSFFLATSEAILYVTSSSSKKIYREGSDLQLRFPFGP